MPSTRTAAGNLIVRQRGFTLLILLLALLVGGASLFLAARDPASARAARDERNRAQALHSAAAALIAYNLGDPDVPGALSCPDFDSDGTADSNCQSGSDPVYVARLPWRTLDMDREYGRLWYALDRDFRDDPSAVKPLNATVPGSLAVGGKGGFAAVLISPGEALPGQARPSTSPSDYLEGGNADGDLDFVDCTHVADCNDRVRGIRVDRLFTRVQRRVLGEVEVVLRDFFADRPGAPAGGYLPYAADFGTTVCEQGRERGQLPLGPGDCGAGEVLDSMDFPQWVRDNDWLDLVVYHVDPACVEDQKNCGSGTLVLGSDAGLDAVAAAAGRAHTGQDRSAGADVADYLDAPINTDADGQYKEQTPSGADNDVFRGMVMP